jgi:hypothetical protein
MDTTHVDPIRYCRFVGKLLYLLHACLNIAYVVNVISQYMQANI